MNLKKLFTDDIVENVVDPTEVSMKTFMKDGVTYFTNDYHSNNMPVVLDNEDITPEEVVDDIYFDGTRDSNYHTIYDPEPSYDCHGSWTIGRIPYTTAPTGLFEFNSPAKQYKYHEPEILNDLKEYIDSTYEKHYAKGSDGLQINDLIMSIGHGEGAFISNAIEYLGRYGKKEGNNVVDLYKAIHNVMLLIHLNHKK